MTLIIPPGFMLVAVRFALVSDAEPMIFTFGADTNGDPAAVVDLVAGNLMAAVPASGINAGWSFIGVRGTVGQDGGPPSIVENTSVVVGTAGANGLPNNCAYLVKKSSNTGGRQGRGRMYIPPFVGAEGDVDQSGVLTPAFQGNLQSFVDNLVSGVDGFILHGSSSPAAMPSAITQWTVDRRIATQRRRMR